MPTNPARESDRASNRAPEKTAGSSAAPAKDRKDPKPTKEQEEAQQDQFKTEIEERPYLDTEGGD